MKNQLSLFVATLAILFTFLTASAQGEWKWANYWTGNDDPLNSNTPFNHVVRTAFDDDGNVYVFGSFGGNATMYAQNGNTHFANDVSIVSNSSPGNVLAKFNPQGNLLWYKSIKSTNGNCLPYDMVIKDGLILIAGEYSWNYAQNKPLWFFDTLITTQTALSYGNGAYQPPYTFGNYSYFVYFDPDGNIIQKHFVQTISRELDGGGGHGIFPLGSRFTGGYPVCVDNDNNIYIAISMQYKGNESDPYGIIIDADTANTAITYNLYLPGNYCGLSLNNIMLYKFTSDWRLAWGKPLVHHTEGLAPAIPSDTVNPSFRPFVGGMSIDDDGNLYVSGHLMDMWVTDQYNQYPMYIYWDSTHRATIDDHGLAFCMPFVIKYDSAGIVQWSNQPYMKHEPTATWYNKIYWTDNCVAGSSVYIMGDTRVSEGYNTLYYFDNENQVMNANQTSCFFARFNKNNGSFENCGVVPGESTYVGSGTSKPAVVNNHFVGLFKDSFCRYYVLGQFSTNGIFKKGDTIIVNNSSTMSANQEVVINETGHILNSFITTQDLSFGHDLTLNFDDHQHSHAVIALRSDPSILEPYPIDSTGVAQYDERLDRIRLYPNPATDRVVIESPEGLPVSMVAVTNESGQLLFLQPATSCRTEISVRDLPSGLYVAHVSTSVGSTAIKFVVRN